LERSLIHGSGATVPGIAALGFYLAPALGNEMNESLTFQGWGNPSWHLLQGQH